MTKIQKLKNKMSEHELDAFIIMSTANMKYISEFSGSNGVVIISKSKNILITDPRYTIQAGQETSDFEVITYTSSLFDEISKCLKSCNIKNIGYETNIIDDLTITTLKNKDFNITFVPKIDFLMEIRQIKDETEISNLRQAIKISDLGLKNTLPLLRSNMTEREFAIELEYQMKKAGSEREAFDTIVVSGQRTALVHGKPTNKIINSGDMVTVDFGAVYNGYHSDITRTLWFGEPSKEMQNIFDIVCLAQKTAFEAISPGVSGKVVEDAHRQVFLDANLEQYSLRGLGHGVGLDIHELPMVTVKTDVFLEKNMIFTVEPGLYIPNLGGVRTEDIVLITDDSYEIVTNTPTKIIIN